MAINKDDGSRPRGSRWRTAAWTAAALVLLLPLVAMPFTDEVNWDLADFVFAGILLLSVGIPFELAARKTGDTVYLAAVGVALAAAFMLVSANAAVGIIGAEDSAVNLLYGGVLAIGVVGALLARFQPRGMARAMAATALAQASVAVGALVAGLGSPGSGPLEIVALNGFFIALWVGSAVLFRDAARGESERSTV